MHNFIITKNTSLLNQGDLINNIGLDHDYSIYSNHSIIEISKNSWKLLLLGDCINKKIINSLEIIDIDYIINNLKGSFYAILIKEGHLYITSSAFGILPLYYSEDFSIIASSVKLIKDNLKERLSFNKKWLINQLLFNYQFGTDTALEGIKLFPAMSYLKINDSEKPQFIKYYSVADELVDTPQPWGKSLDELSDLFIKTMRDYIPEDNAIISFTGGFDGRTLVSIGIYFKKRFRTFSYGKKENDDVSIPSKNSKDLGLNYLWYNLDKEYSKNDYLKSAKNYIQATDGENGFLYAHVDFSARKLSKETDTLISGVCGSELFRAAHHGGAVTSSTLLSLFSSETIEEYIESVYQSDALKYIDKKEYEDAINDVVESTWSYKSSLKKSLTNNQKLYVFVYEEIFRKFFGAWVKDQMNYLNVRTPFLDFEFFKKLIKSELSGAYSDFLTENPLKRFKGQVLYADILKKTNAKIYHTKTGKGYAPIVVREPFLRPLLFLPYILKRLKRKAKPVNLDNLGIISGVKNNLPNLLATLDTSVFNNEKVIDNLNNLTPHTKESERDTLLTLLSVLEYKKQLDEKKDYSTY